MNIITLENISKNYSDKILLNNVSLGINDGDKIGLIGINGAGKSTFLKVVSGREEFFDGNIVKGKNVRIEYLDQNPLFDEDATVLEQIFKGDTKEMKLLKRYEELLDKINSCNGENFDSLNNELLKVQSEIDSLSLWDMESEAKTILNKLGIKNYSEKVGNLSGGQKKRIALACSLITPCDLLILDEPTNHLDSDSIEWLEEFLNSRKGALLMITHDRYFLDRVTNRIIELDRGNLYTYPGNYTAFLEKKIERIEVEQSQEEKKNALIRNELKWVRRGAKARTTKQKARLQRFDELVSEESIKRQEDVDISFVGSRLGKKVVELYDISKSFGSKVIIKDFNYIFLRNDRIGIIGENGAGKTTLVNILRGRLPIDSGKIEIGDTVKIGCFAQDNSNMDPKLRVIDYVKEGGEYIPVEDGTKIMASTMCERFLFDSTMQYTPIEKLSGGERRRLHLLRVLMESPNFLILDEPTNDLDIETLKILEDFLDKFMGVIIVVSHDRYFLDRICTKIFSYEGNGYIKEYNGNYSDFLISKEIEKIKSVESNDKSGNEFAADKGKGVKEKTKDNKPKFTFKEQKEYETIDEDIAKLEEKINSLEKEMAKNASNYGKLNELMHEKEEVQSELDNKYERWEYLNEIAEAIEEFKNNN
ncbi:ABC-F family ATP-binding cassette domain-containing protein [Clostridium beijerinckii]|jgi:ATPase components of ABC transporters with duplicated ATPase domains|uniref:ABC-F family ATP-binding cassette domain-containing protein n=2 Tax=Clostridium beijerinckii TaxID=1520 RepID=A0AAE2RS37_CLOBE|nr:ABC-F family ATP-binding cassette domain-containing protein [Clostridium beijerinckii]ABR34799.1 ABC transporter related [Clostridium beijerinckii NCIMB 8052]AIU01629.1 ABC transporter related protein [Clostridium beijerinckii ATCC 35702]MBF7810572.1 ABC-F family ATP-binding cassette domain-containing protein [Clostridium beijerinckii]NOW91288.1 ATP-binding cassette subfamily F protein uup [Clostridium beijerinckii]NRT23846.1 ATP-binding cassette subfamily F protein uup [Clostridium beijeri